MALFDKLKFWKKEESSDLSAPEFSRPEFAQPEQQGMPSNMDQMGLPRSVPGLNEPPAETSSPFAQPPQSFGQMQQPQFAQQQFGQQAVQPSADQQLQLISSKLDTIKAQLETVLQRLDRLERKEDLSPYQQRWKTGV